MFIRTAKKLSKCGICKGPIFKGEKFIVSGHVEWHGRNICVHCLSKADTFVKEKKQWDQKGWNFLAKAGFKITDCSLCNVEIPKEDYRFISKYYPSNGRTQMSEPVIDYLCPECIEKFVSEWTVEEIEESECKRFEHKLLTT